VDARDIGERSDAVDLLWKPAPLADGYPKVTRVAVFSDLALR